MNLLQKIKKYIYDIIFELKHIVQKILKLVHIVSEKVLPIFNDTIETVYI